MVGSPNLRAFLAATIGRVRHLPAPVARSVAATAVVCVVLFAAIMGVNLALTAGTAAFAGLYSAPTTAVLAFQPFAHGGADIDIEEAARARRDILSDPLNPLRCVARPDMTSAAVPLMSLPAAGDFPPAAGDYPPPAEAPAAVGPVQITDSTAALLPARESVIATVPRGVEFFEAYAFVLTALNGGVDSWQRFVSVTTQTRLGTPVDASSAVETASGFFVAGSDLDPTHALAAAVMLRLSSSRVVDGEQEAGQLLERAVNACL